MLVLNQGDGLQSTTDRDLHAIGDDLLGRSGNRHHAGGALPVHAHAGNAGWQTGTDETLTGRILEGGALLHCSAHHDIVDVLAIQLGALDSVLDDVAAQFLGLGVIEGAAIGLADRRACSGNDNSFAHGEFSLKRLSERESSRASRQNAARRTQRI